MLLYVRPEHRHSMVGYKLIKSWIDLANSRGATCLVAGTTMGYKPESVVRLYKRLGFTDLGTVLQRDL